jgi:3-deoxy-manno-octulosonate cytidylyltransferase (CMP-KDO synthetase)
MNSKSKIIGLIPSRLESVRLPGKALLDICGIPMVIHTYQRALLSKLLDEVYICTDSIEIAKVCKKFNAPHIMTASRHRNGTERIAEASKQFSNVDFFIDIQGDEPLIDPNHIDSVINFHKNNDYDLILPHINTEEIISKNIVKVIESGGRVIYLTRANCPFPFREKLLFKKHLSIISFSSEALSLYSNLNESTLERVEGVELLRAIENNMSIGTFELRGESFSVDVGEDYANAIKRMENDPLFLRYSQILSP